MSWLRLDDGFADGPKISHLTDAQAWRWVRVLLYCARFETDGHVPEPVLKREGLWRIRADLVRFELLDDRVENGLWVHDFLDYNPSHEDKERERERWREYKRASRNGDDVHGGHSRDSRERQDPSAQGRSPTPNPLNPNPQRGQNDPATLLALLPRETAPELVEHIHGLASAFPDRAARAVEEIGAGVVDPVGHALRVLQAAA